LAISVATSDIGKPGWTTGGPVKGAVLIAGPTASGKSALALDYARRLGGVVVNADSMQVYGMLRLLTARPSDDDMAAAPHLLYGHVDPGVAYSTGAWLRDVKALADGGAFEGRPPVFVGGTGLYFKALTDGLSAMPDVPADLRTGWRNRLAAEGAAALHSILAERDPEAAKALRPGDGQRIVRALEVLDASGRSIRTWQGERGKPLLDVASAQRIVIEPDRAELALRIERRFDGMVAAGAMEEARAFARLSLPASVPAAKAIGLRELLAADAGDVSLAAAIDQAKTATRQYAKRQMTWFRNQLGERWARRVMPE
jgi:tRNA dimethylallyltransferase